MYVICKINNILELDDNSVIARIRKYILLSDGQLNLEKNKKYCVYGIVFRDTSPWYYLCLDKDDESPRAYPAELFKIMDASLSSYWNLSVDESSIVFEEWANDSSFYERLVDGDPIAIKQFKSYQNLINKECWRKTLKPEKEYTLHELVLFLIEHPLAIDNYCIYTIEDYPEAMNDLVCYIDSYPDVNDNDEEVYSEFIVKKSLFYYISGQQLADIIVNTIHQKTDADMDDYIKNINYYLEYDTFLDFI